MNSYTHLVGHEDVKNAGYAMQHAAESIRTTSGFIEEALHHHQRFMDEWLSRFEAVLREDREARTAQPETLPAVDEEAQS